MFGRPSIKWRLTKSSNTCPSHQFLCHRREENFKALRLSLKKLHQLFAGPKQLVSARTSRALSKPNPQCGRAQLFTNKEICLALYFAVTKLRHYMLLSVVQVISKINLIKYMLTWPIIRCRIGKWTMALSFVSCYQCSCHVRVNPFFLMG